MADEIIRILSIDGGGIRGPLPELSATIIAHLAGEL
jgi:patatin-like phospholipase/acyl hydrolase